MIAAVIAAAVGGVTASAAAGAAVLNVRFGGDARTTRIVIDLDRATTGAVTQDGDGRRLELKLPKVEPSTSLQGRGQGLVQAYAMEKADGGARLSLDLASDVRVKRRFLLSPMEGSPNYRYVVDLEAVGAAPAEAAPTRVAEAPKAVKTNARAKPLVLKKVIVIDAGHGGKDPGAAGQVAREKDITLAAAQTLKAKLERTGRYKVVMTRDSDTYIPLDNRVQISRSADADLFISLHADAGGSPATRGASVYTRSERSAGRISRVLGRNEWFRSDDLAGRDRSVGDILLDLTQRSTTNQSAVFAEMLLGELGECSPLLARSHRDAGFFVLLAPDVPAVLLEMGFLTNPDDEAFLANPAKRSRLMQAVANSIDSYFDRPMQVAER